MRKLISNSKFLCSASYAPGSAVRAPTYMNSFHPQSSVGEVLLLPWRHREVMQLVQVTVCQDMNADSLGSRSILYHLPFPAFL